MSNTFLDPILGWLLLLHPALAIVLVSLLVSLIVTLAIKLFTNQSLMKDLRNELKELQKEMKALKNNPDKMQKVNSRFMETNMKYMSHSMRPTLFTFIPIILVFGWLSSHLGYMPLVPGEPFKVTAIFDEAAGKVTMTLPEGLSFKDIEGQTSTKDVLYEEVDWLVLGEEGTYQLQIEHMNKVYDKEVIISKSQEYAPVEKDYRKRVLFFSSSNGNLQKVILDNEKIRPFSTVPVIRDIPWVGSWGWLGVYFLFSIIFSMSLRRVFNIY